MANYLRRIFFARLPVPTFCAEFFFWYGTEFFVPNSICGIFFNDFFVPILFVPRFFFDDVFVLTFCAEFLVPRVFFAELLCSVFHVDIPLFLLKLNYKRLGTARHKTRHNSKKLGTARHKTWHLNSLIRSFANQKLFTTYYQ